MSTNTMTTQQSASDYTTEQQPTIYQQFLQDYPTYQATRLLDEWRQTEYGRLDAHKQVCLD